MGGGGEAVGASGGPGFDGDSESDIDDTDDIGADDFDVYAGSGSDGEGPGE